MTNASFEQLHPRKGVGVNKGQFATKPPLDKGSRVAFDDLDLEDPPYIDENGVKRWIQRGQLHREGGPAVEYPDGTKEWRINGELHREGGPARELPDGTYEWYSHGQLHRDGGPARELPDGTYEWYSHGQLHRDGGPAKEEANGTKRWYKNGELDREGAPAVEFPDGSYEYYSHGQLHNEGAPAARYYFSSGNKSVEIWYFHGERHREGAPAVVWSTGQTEWYFRGKRHREGGPAIDTDSSITRQWYIHGKMIPGPVVEDIRSQCSELEKLPHFSGTSFEGECAIYHFGKSAAIAVEKTPEGGVNALYSYNRLKSDADRLDAALKMVRELNREKAN